MVSVSVIILAYGREPLLQDCINAVLESRGIDLEIVLVDNGSPAVRDISTNPRVRVLDPGFNTGFAGGCNYATSQVASDTVVFVNSDLIVDPDAIANLVLHLADEQVGLATGAVLLPGTPMRVNSIGNPIHYLMFSWAGSFGELFDARAAPKQVAGVSGAFFGCRREYWIQLDGFDEQFFAYAEDADLSLRTWQSGKQITFEPSAVGIHHYEFTKNHSKWFLLERNRLICLLTLYDTRTLLLLVPIAIPIELGILLASLRGGWIKEKLASWRWLITNINYLRLRRRTVAAAKVSHDSVWSSVLEGRMDIPSEFGLRVPEFINWILEHYWRMVRRRLR
jgi:GT2 family glycosyltransferase